VTIRRVGSGQFDLLEEIRMGRVNLYVDFFRSLIDFDWIEGHLISGRSGQFDFLKKMGRVGSGSGPNGSGGFLGSGQVLSPLIGRYSIQMVSELRIIIKFNMSYHSL
jgi:hypothetical protein